MRGGRVLACCKREVMLGCREDINEGARRGFEAMAASAQAWLRRCLHCVAMTWCTHHTALWD